MLLDERARESDRQIARWIPVAGYILFIYLTIPIAPRLWLWLGEYTTLTLDRLALVVVLLAAAIVILPALLRPRLRTFAGIALLIGVYAVIYQLPFETPAERVHLAEYGLLPGLAAWAQGRRKPLRARLVIGALVGAAAGAGDEIIQALTPGRFFQVTDMALNAACSCLGAIGCGIVWGGRDGAAAISSRSSSPRSTSSRLFR